MDRRMLFAGLVILLVGSVILAKPGSVTTKDGDTLKGDVTEKDGFVIISVPGKPDTKLYAANVKTIAYDLSVDEEYKKRHDALGVKDVKGRIALGAWASSHDRSDLAVAVLNEARAIDPMDKEAARASDAANSQLDLDQKARAAADAKAHPTTGPAVATTGPTTGPTAGAAGKPPRKMADRRLLNADEINMIRQKEMQTSEKLTIRFDNQVVKKYLATGNRDAAAFNRMPAQEQALEILTNGTPEMAKDVKIMTDPVTITEFKNKVMPIVAIGCASNACHGGGKAGNFQLYSGNATANVYSNFYILQTYSKTVGDAAFSPIDRSNPDRSLVLQFGLPAADAQPAHPVVPGYRPRFKSKDDPAYQTISEYINKSLSSIQPNYGVDVSPMLPPAATPSGGGPATQPAAPAQ